MGKILLIDDAQCARMVLKTLLEDTGYEVCGEASNGREGVEKYRQLKPDLVFCDERMNEMNGTDFLRAIMEEDPGANVVVCTAISDELHISEWMDMGAKGYIEKPIQGAKLLQITEKLIGKPTVKMSYKKLMERRAEAAGLEKKPLLDFFEAFRSVNGFAFDDPRVDEQFMRENRGQVFVSVRALLAPKITMQQIRQLEDVFMSLL